MVLQHFSFDDFSSIKKKEPHEGKIQEKTARTQKPAFSFDHSEKLIWQGINKNKMEREFPIGLEDLLSKNM